MTPSLLSLHGGAAKGRGKAELGPFFAMIIHDWRIYLFRAGLNIFMQLMQPRVPVPGSEVQDFHNSMMRLLPVDDAIGGYLRAILSRSKTSGPREY